MKCDANTERYCYGQRHMVLNFDPCWINSSISTGATTKHSGTWKQRTFISRKNVKNAVMKMLLQRLWSKNKIKFFIRQICPCCAVVRVWNVCVPVSCLCFDYQNENDNLHIHDFDIFLCPSLTLSFFYHFLNFIRNTKSRKYSLFCSLFSSRFANFVQNSLQYM